MHLGIGAQRVKLKYLEVLTFKQATVEPLRTDTSIIWTPLYYGKFSWSLRDQNPYKAHFSKTVTSIIRTLIPVSLVSVIKRFDCTPLVLFPLRQTKGRFTRYDFVACDKLTTGLRHKLYRVNQTYNSLTTVVYVIIKVVGF